jgi:uncharacterized phage-associated protein
LDAAQRIDTPVTNLALQKLLYFCHAKYLIEKSKPLLKGHFEAWTYGPVQPLVYAAFKECGGDPIQTRACAQDVISKKPIFLPPVGCPSAQQYILETVATYGRVSAGRLVEISHAVNGPWDFIVKRARESVSLGLRIPDSVIVERFKFHKVTVSSDPRSGEPHEDAPLTRN